ncbi:hypothetical protein [Aquimarina sp. AU474]|uniref:hypothetical protein n=1 Tax=Aquimarina sp. AU474 TaxID=2108529 RepID=UPI000D693657|nr:hypothetical protein [Aquimarina sp. AU474]
MRNILITAVAILTTVFSLSAQSEAELTKNKKPKKEFYQNLSEDQRAQLDLKREMLRGHKSAMEATFTQEQLAIVDNENLSRKERRKEIASTMNEEQKAMVKEHREAVKAKNEEFKATLSPEQLQEYESFRKRRGRKDKGDRRKN